MTDERDWGRDLAEALEHDATMETVAASEVGREAIESGERATLGELYIEAQNGATPEDLDARPELAMPGPLKPGDAPTRW